jgi:CRISPR-associated protein Csm1
MTINDTDLQIVQNMENAREAINTLGNLILVKGDISGIQEFIFSVKSKGAAKSLKGRSFFMKVLTEIAIQHLFDKFGVIESDRSDFRISTSGGNFFLKLPNIAEHEIIIQESQLLISKSLRYSGVNLSLNWVMLDETNYKQCLGELNKKVRESKLKLFSNLNQDDFNELFLPNNKKEFTNIDDNKNWIPITEKLKSSNFFTITKTGWIDLKVNADSIELIGYKCKFHNNENDPKKNPLSNYLEKIFPINDYGQTKEFEELVKLKHEGDQKLGILKMDVDNLGVTLENVESISDHKNFDLKLKEFFNNELRKIVNRDLFIDNIYTVTAGGDDSFFVGHWKKILELATAINTQFMKHPYFKEIGLSISAGYIIVNPKFPVIRFSQLAEDALHKAKYKYEKGNICIFDEVISWEILKEIKHFKVQLAADVTGKSKGLLARARQSAISGIDDDQISLKENWEIAYYLRDHKDKRIVKEIRDNIIKSSEEKGKNPKEKQLKRSLRLILPIAARLTELEKR